MNEFGPNDSETLAKLKLDKSQVEDAITVNVTELLLGFEYPQSRKPIRVFLL